MAKLLINDGYNLNGRVEPIGPWPAVAFVYRPALPERVQVYLDERGSKARSDAAVKLLTDHLQSWDVDDDRGQPAPATEANLRRVPFPVREKLVDFVCGYQGSADEKNSASGSASS